MGFMHEHGFGVPKNLERAKRYYKRVIELSPAFETRMAIYVSLIRMDIMAYFEDGEGAPFWVQYLFKVQQPGLTDLPSTPELDLRGVLSTHAAPYLPQDILNALVCLLQYFFLNCTFLQF